MKRILLSFLGFLLAFVSWANNVTPQQAKATAQAFLSSKGVSLKSEASPYRAPRKTRSGVSAEQSYYYVFNVENDKGFVIVSGDDRTEQILGYVDEGNFDANNLPENMRSWLQLYADQIKYLDDNNIQIDGEASRARAKAKRISQTRHSIPVLMTTKWNQGDPYNMSCPDYYKEDGTTAKPASGCVATALAQVMNYYKYPEKTTAIIPSHSNTYKVVTPSGAVSERKSTARAVARGTVIDWDNMCDVYDGDETEAQRKAVGDLMLYVGQSVKMGWGPSSGAGFGSNVAEAFQKYFGYDDGCYAAGRGDYTVDEWFDLLYNELATGHPIGFAGASSGGAHAFVLDGFDGEQLFHLNWGWGGHCDGWFLVNILNPDDNTGIGASSSSDGYSMGQTAIIGVNYPDNVKAESTACLTINDVTVTGTSVKASYINWTGSTNSFLITMLVYNEEDKTFSPVSGTSQNISNLGANYYHTITTNLSGKFAPGTYKVTPASRLASSAKWQPRFNCQSEYILVEVSESRVTTVKHVKPVEDISVEKVEFTGLLEAGKEQEMKVTFKNNGDEYNREIHIFASKTEDKVYCDNRSAVVIRKGESTVTSFYFTPQETGTYNIWLCTSNNGSGEVYRTTVEVVDGASIAKPSLHVNSVKILNASSKNVYGDRMIGNVVIRNQKNIPYNGKIRIQIWEQGANNSGTYYGGSSVIKEVTVPASRTATVDFAFENLKYGRHYYIVFKYVTLDSDLSNGGLWIADHQFLVNPGIVYWKNNGTVAGVGAATTFTTPATACGVLFDQVTVPTLRANKNPNTIFAFSDSEVTLPRGVDGLNVVVDGVADSVNFTHDYAFYAPCSFTASHATYSYTFPVATDSTLWHGITLPFTATKATIDGVDYEISNEYNHFFVYEFSAIDDDNTPMFSPVKEMRGNASYIIACDSLLYGKTIVFEGDNVVISQTGSTKMVTSSNSYNLYGLTYTSSLTDVYVLNAEGTAYVYSDKASLSPLDAYFTTSLSKEARLETITLPEIPKDIPVVDGIGNLKENVHIGSHDVYSLSGQKVGVMSNGRIPSNGLRPGIYVVNGRKIMVK